MQQRLINDEFDVEQTVHASGQLMRVFGEKYRIPGYLAFRSFDDPYARLQGNKLKLTEDLFVTAYNDPVAFFNWVKNDVWNDENVRTPFITWLKQHVPPGFQRDKYRKVRKKIKRWDNGKLILGTPYEKLSQREQEKIRSLFAGIGDGGIFIAPKQTPLEAIREDRASEYLASVYETVEEDGRVISRIQ